ncbi:MAG: Rab family GTPase [Promethearchaeota archaeon]
MSEEKTIFQPRTEAIYKVIVIGDPSVGKTSLLTKFSSKKFQTQYIPTVGTNILKEIVDLDDKGDKITVNLLLWDIAGQPQFYMLHKPYFNGADGMMFIFDVTRQSTFSNVKNWYNTTVKFGLSGIPRVLIGNKIDLKEDRKIKKPHADHLSRELNASYFETSAKTGVNVNMVFQKIAGLVYHSKSRGKILK